MKRIPLSSTHTTGSDFERRRLCANGGVFFCGGKYCSVVLQAKVLEKLYVVVVELYRHHASSSSESTKSDDDDDDDDESCVESFTESSSSTTLVLLRVLVARVLPRAFIPVRSDNMRRLATYVRSWTAYLSAAEPLERINKFRRKRSYMRRWSRIATLEIVLLSAVCIIKRDSVNNKEQLRQTPGVCT